MGVGGIGKTSRLRGLMSIQGAAAARDTAGKTWDHTIMALGVRLEVFGFILCGMRESVSLKLGGGGLRTGETHIWEMRTLGSHLKGCPWDIIWHNDCGPGTTGTLGLLFHTSSVRYAPDAPTSEQVFCLPSLTQSLPPYSMLSSAFHFPCTLFSLWSYCLILTEVH